MTNWPSVAPTPELAAAFPTRLEDPEQLVYQFVLAASQQNLASGLPALSFYADRARAAAEGRRVDVVRGWPAFPGVVPAIGIAAGTEGEDQQNESEQGGFAGRQVARTQSGAIAGFADYYAQPIYAPIIVQLVHENRDERDRLHNELRRLLFPLKTQLLQRSALIKKVRVDAEKTEAMTGPAQDEQPLIAWLSLFTVHVYHEMLEARDVHDASHVPERIDATVDPVAIDAITPLADRSP